MGKIEDEAYELLEEMTTNNYQWLVERLRVGDYRSFMRLIHLLS